MAEGPKVCVDVDYRATSVVAACVGFEAWAAPEPSFEKTLAFAEAPAEHESGQFYRRELPYLLALLRSLPNPPAVVIIDGFVWLDGGRPGLGAHLAEAFGGGTPIIGVAKRPFQGAAETVELLRGTSQVPLFVSAQGVTLGDAVAHVAAMHGEYRIPTLLKRVDRLSRSA